MQIILLPAASLALQSAYHTSTRYNPGFDCLRSSLDTRQAGYCVRMTREKECQCNPAAGTASMQRKLYTDIQTTELHTERHIKTTRKAHSHRHMHIQGHAHIQEQKKRL